MKNDGETTILQAKEIYQTKDLDFPTNLPRKTINLKNNSIINKYFTKKKRYHIFTINNISLILIPISIIIFSFCKVYKEYYKIYGQYRSIIKPGTINLFNSITHKQNKKIYCADSRFNYPSSLFKLLEYKYNLIFTDENPDYVFYSLNGNNHSDPKYDNSIKIFQTYMSFIPDFNECDYAFGNGYLNYEDRYIRFPFYLRRENINELEKERAYIAGKKFCAWVVTNKNFKFRNKFFDELSKYKKIDSGGKFKNNVGGRVENKIMFLSDYKFSIQFENCATPGYSTEKIFEGFKAGTIPIYYGDETIVDIINPNSFILVRNESDFKNVIKLIKKIDKDEGLYKKILKEPIYRSDFNEYRFLKEEEKIKNFLYHIFDQDLDKAKRRYVIK